MKACRFDTVGVGAYRDHFDYLNGDINAVTNPDRSPDVGRHPPERVLAGFCGRPIDPTHLPTRMRPNRRRRVMPDLVSMPVGVMCSHKVRDIVEGLEPSVHAFYPVTFEWKSGDPDETHFVWIVQRALKALHPDLVEPPYPGPDKFWDGDDPYSFPDRKLVFSKSAIGAAHIWSDPQLRYHRYMTQDLAEALIAADTTGLSVGPWIDVV